jgi:hypothetical protein
MEPRAGQGELHKFVHQVMPKSRLPAWATAETPDTPRAVMRAGGRDFARLTAVVNGFLPSCLPFINSGFEVYERQPMNLGLDNIRPGRFALPRSDPYYGKLAYFDRVALHWCNRGGKDMVDLLARVGRIRVRFLADLTDPRNYFAPTVITNARSILAVGWRVAAGASTLLVVANLDFQRRRRTQIDVVPRSRGRRDCDTLLELHPSRTRPSIVAGGLRLSLEPVEVKVVLL